MDEEMNGAMDNSPSLDEQIQSILDENQSEETETQDLENNEETKENQETQDGESESKEENTEIPKDFLNDDGTVKVQDLLKAYESLKPLEAEKSNWEQERIEFQKQTERLRQLQTEEQAKAFQLGYNSKEELDLALQVASAQAEEFKKYLYLVQEPDKVRGLLALYAQSPTDDLLAQIEDEFNVDVVKHVSVFGERVRNQLIQNQEAQRYQTIRQEAETFVKNSVKEFPEWFKVPEFRNFFADALRTKGDMFLTSEFVKHIENLREYFKKEFLAEQNANSENEKEKNTLKTLSPQSSKVVSITKKVEDYTPEELEKAISELV